MVQGRRMGSPAPVLLLAVGILGVMVLAAGYVLARKSDGKTSRADPAENAPLARVGSDETPRLEGEVLALRTQMAALRAEVLGAKADPKSTDTDKPAQDDRTPEQINADDERRYRDYMAGVSRSVRSRSSHAGRRESPTPCARRSPLTASSEMSRATWTAGPTPVGWCWKRPAPTSKPSTSDCRRS